MTKLYFIRHGQTENNAKGIVSGQIDTKLTQKGINDAKIKGKEINLKFDYYYCSPLKRTQQTLMALMGDVPYTVDNRVIDINIGDWTGIPRTQISDIEYKKYVERTYFPPNAENASQVDERIKSFMKDMFEKHKDKNILIVTHGIIIRYLKLMFYGEVKGTTNLEVFEVTEDMIKSLKA